MATTSIWRVNGWLGKVLIYVENPDKTENPAVFEKQGMDGQEAQSLSDVIEYAVRQEKTGRIAPDEEGAPVMQRFVSGVNCCPTTARDEMIADAFRLAHRLVLALPAGGDAYRIRVFLQIDARGADALPQRPARTVFIDSRAENDDGVQPLRRLLERAGKYQTLHGEKYGDCGDHDDVHCPEPRPGDRRALSVLPRPFPEKEAAKAHSRQHQPEIEQRLPEPHGDALAEIIYKRQYPGIQKEPVDALFFFCHSVPPEKISCRKDGEKPLKVHYT